MAERDTNQVFVGEFDPRNPDVQLIHPEILQHLHLDDRVYHELTSGFGELGDGYRAFLKERLHKTPGFIGEVAIPQSLQNPDVLDMEIITDALHMGFGHPRVQRAYRWLMDTMGFSHVKHVFVGGRTRQIPSYAANIADSALELYNRQSVENAYTNAMYEGEPYEVQENRYTYILRKMIDIYLKAQRKKATPADIANLFSSHDTTKSKEELEKSYRAIAPFITFMTNNHFSNSRTERKKPKSLIFFHPIFEPVADYLKKKYPNLHAVAVVTDRVVEPAWFTRKDSIVRVVSAMDSGRTEAAEFWGLTEQEKQEKFPVVNGFPMPMAGFMRKELAEKRRDALLQNPAEPITHILTASGVAIAQQKSFQEYIDSIESHIQDGSANVVVQCGFGDIGKMLYNSLETYLSKKDPRVQERVCLHWAKSPEGAVDFFEGVAHTEKPIVLAVKASEMPNMAADMGLPCVILGCVGNVEDGNVELLGKLPDVPIVFTKKIVQMAKDDNRKRLLEERMREESRQGSKQSQLGETRDAEIDAQIQKEMEHLDAIAIDSDKVQERLRQLILNHPPNHLNPQAMMNTLEYACGVNAS